MLAKKYIKRIIESGQLAKRDIDKEDDQITEIDIQKALGHLDGVKYELEAAQILLREEMKERRRMEM